MNNGPRLDSKGSFHHVICRAVEGCHPFAEAESARLMLDCLGKAHARFPHGILAWALMSNHLHLLVRCASPTLSAFMQLAQLRFAQVFNRRKNRRGHLFQGRFLSILVERGDYLLELVRYIHLNPIRAGILETLEALDSYPHTGHLATVDGRPKSWHDLEGMLSLFGSDLAESLENYRVFLDAGMGREEEPELETGNWLIGSRGLVRNEGLGSTSRRFSFSGAVMGSATFAKRVIRRRRGQCPDDVRHRREDRETLEVMIGSVCRAMVVPERRLLSNDKGDRAVAGRRVLLELLSERTAMTRSDMARLLRLSPAAVTGTMARRMTPFETDCYSMISASNPKDVKTEGGRGGRGRGRSQEG